MQKIGREDIQIIAKHSNWSNKGVSKALEDHVYHKAKDWHQFLKWLFLGLGISFAVAGVIFFFAYNWDDLHKFVKLGIIGFLTIACVLGALLTETKPPLKKMLVTAASILVGVLLAVFGQVYQTGANAYELFLNWTFFIALWVVIVHFAPLWTVFVTLVNVTIVLYSEQVAHRWSEVFLFTLLFWINTIILVVFILVGKWRESLYLPTWFTHLLALAAITCSTLGNVTGIFDAVDSSYYLLTMTTLLVYAAGIWYGLSHKSPFYLSIIAFSLIVISSAYLIRLSDDAGMFLLISLYIITAITLVIWALIKLHKKWNP
ncbi:MAG: DUF2157 domain-containing protein [Bacteroidota bacterium]